MPPEAFCCAQRATLCPKSRAMDEEFDKQQPGLPGTMTPAALQQTHAKLLARAARWKGQDAPSVAQLRLLQ